MKYRLICSDVDGTLINSDEIIPEENLSAIRRLKSEGCYFAITSGRFLNAVRQMSEHFKITPYKVCSNGAVVADEDGNVLQAVAIPLDIAKQLYKVGEDNNCLMGYNTLSCAVYNRRNNMEDELYKRADELYEGYDASTGKHTIDVKYQEGYSVPFQFGDAYKISLWANDQSSYERITEELNNFSGISVTSAMQWNLEITAKNVTKWFGVQSLMKLLNITKEEVVCIGDSMNDEAMVNGAGLGVCMGNGNPKLKQEADYITDTNYNSGVAAVINKCLNNEL